MIFAGIVLKIESVCTAFFKCHDPCPSLPSVVTDDRKQFQNLNIVVNNKPGPLFLEFY